MTAFIRYLQMFLHLPSGECKLIGHLSMFGDSLRVSFTEAYINDAKRPTLSLAYLGADDATTRNILTAARDSRLSRNDGRWPVYFQNLLPEGHNRERLARQRGCALDDEFDLLAAAGHDLMGAIEVKPLPLDQSVPDAVGRWHTALNLQAPIAQAVEAPVEDAASLPGVITKFSAVMEGRRYVIKRQGAAGSTILKLPTQRHPDSVANEFAGFALCKAVGLDCAQASVISRNDADLPDVIPFPDILAVQRFDRGPNGQRIHMEEFAQVLGYEPRHKYGRGFQKDYADMLRILDRLSTRPAHDVQEFVNRIVAFILMGNTDAHLKNWALIYPDGVHPQLSPLYDPVCITAFFEDAPERDYAVNRTIDRTVRAITWQDIQSLLKNAGILRQTRILKTAKELVAQARAEWPALLESAPANMRRAITERLSGGIALTS